MGLNHSKPFGFYSPSCMGTVAFCSTFYAACGLSFFKFFKEAFLGIVNFVYIYINLPYIYMCVCLSVWVGDGLILHICLQKKLM